MKNNNDIPTTDTNEIKQLINRVKRGELDRVRELLAIDPSLAGAQEEDDTTPLHYAAWKGQVEVAAALLAAGADVNARNQNAHWGGTPLHAAAHANQRAVAELLIAHGAGLDARSVNGRTPLEETAIHNATAVARLLRGAAIRGMGILELVLHRVFRGRGAGAPALPSSSIEIVGSILFWVVILFFVAAATQVYSMPHGEARQDAFLRR